ncbi:MAG: D-alanyl-D-alanine carboxypeptidase [Eubacterium sp.]|nr:D-alanyl-D-alanine carboxypeptidase [Eubacterium sp.]
MKRILSIFLMISLVMSETVLGENEAKIQSDYYVLMEADSGKIIEAKNENETRSPASITKIMTTLLIFDAIKEGKIKLDEMVVTSGHAKSMGGSQVFLEEGEEQTVETMIKCILIASGNDASVAMAERIGGTEEKFVEQMNEKAKKLGMEHTHFVDCCGLTDSKEHFTTAKDVAVMTRELVTRYPEVLNYSSIWMETIIHKTAKGEKEFVLSNTNKLLKGNEYVKGLKTGSTSLAKYCVSNVAVKDGITLISVVLGAPDFKVRFADSNQLINLGFSKCKIYKDSEKDYQVPIIGGVKDTVAAKKKETKLVDTEGIDFQQIRKNEVINPKILAPVKKGKILGKIQYSIGKKKLAETEIVAEETVLEGTYLDSIGKIAGVFLGVQ